MAAMLATHCGGAAAVDPGAAPSQDPAPAPGVRLNGYRAHFVIAWNGARIGDADERITAHGDGRTRFERRERITVRRGQALAHSETDIAIDTGPDLRAHRVDVRQIASGLLRRGSAHRNRHGDWVVHFADESERRIPGDAVPAELVPLLIATADPDRAGVRFDGPVLLPGYGFAVAHLRVEAEGPRTLLAQLSTADGVLQSRLLLTRGGAVARVQTEGGIGARRVDEASARAPFTPPEIVDAASIAVAGAESPGAVVDALVLAGVPPQRARPPRLPGQQVERRGDTWEITLRRGDTCAPIATDPAPAPVPTNADPRLATLAARVAADVGPGSARDQAFALVRATADYLEDDLGTPEGGARDALLLGRGDCTAHAQLFVALAEQRGIATRLVTGYRVDDRRLIRHRWALVAVDGRWIAVDPTYGEAPAAPRLLGLAVHGPRASELALADEIAFAGLAQLSARRAAAPLSDPQCGPSRPRTP